MLIPFSMIVLASQLVIAVVYDVPKFDIARGCKIDSSAAFDPDAGVKATIRRCMDDEQRAKDQLQTQWSGFANSDRVMCTGITTDDKSIPPSYVELQTCLQDQQFVRKARKE